VNADGGEPFDIDVSRDARGRDGRAEPAEHPAPARPAGEAVIGGPTPDEPAAGSGEPADVLELPAASRATDIALDELELVYGFIYARVGNRADAEDLTQQVAMKAIPRLRQGAPASSIRGYLFATARSVLGGFWSTRLGFSEAELHEDLALVTPAPPTGSEGVETVERILSQLSDNYRRVLELRFLHGYSLKEVARDMNSTVGAVKVMQLRALRAAAKVPFGL